MLRYILLRLLLAPVVLLLLATVCFALVRLAPGGPFSSERDLSPEARAQLDARYGFDAPPLVQYGRYIRRLCHLDLGPSTRLRGREVNEIIAEKWFPSFLLGGSAILLALALGVPVGVLAGLRQNRAADAMLSGAALVGLSVPVFVTAPLLVVVFSLHLGWFPTSGFAGPLDLVLPSCALALPFAARFARLARGGTIEALSQDAVRTARAKGLPEHVVVLRHAMPAVLLPIVSYLGPAFAFVATGSLVVERIFAIPGLGEEFVRAALNRDYFLTQGLAIFFGGVLIVCNLCVDVSYGLLDPRIRRR